MKALKILDNDDKVDKWLYESIIIPIDKIHNTVVDLEVYYKDGRKKLIEVKPFKMLKDVDNIKKFKAIIK